jgi:hypothetical protein
LTRLPIRLGTQPQPADRPKDLPTNGCVARHQTFDLKPGSSRPIFCCIAVVLPHHGNLATSTFSSGASELMMSE